MSSIIEMIAKWEMKDNTNTLVFFAQQYELDFIKAELGDLYNIERLGSGYSMIQVSITKKEVILNQ